MGQVSGVVQKISPKQFNGKTFYSFAMSGVDGWFGTGMKKPPTEGTSIKFNSKTNSRGYLEVDGSIEVLTDGSVQPAAGVAGAIKASAATGDGGKSAYWLGKENRDLTNDSLRNEGAARNTALSIVDLFVKTEAIKLPAAAKREEFLLTLISRYTDWVINERKNKVAKLEDLEQPEDLEPAQKDEENWS